MQERIQYKSSCEVAEVCINELRKGCSNWWLLKLLIGVSGPEVFGLDPVNLRDLTFFR